MPLRRSTCSATLAGIAALLIGGPLAPERAHAQGAGGIWPTDEFCGRAQSFVTLGTRRPTNVVHEAQDKFRTARVSLDPLQTQQHTVIDDGTGTARIVSCKLASAEALRAAYGADAARTDSSCALVNRNTFSSVLASLTAAERSRARFNQGKSVAFDRDVMATDAADWSESDEPATVDKRGTLRLAARAFLGDDAGLKVHYCHFIAPEFARRLLLDGSLTPPTTPTRR